MYKLNLTQLDQVDSNIQYKISKFPDGQQSVTITGIGMGSGDPVSPINLINTKCKILSRLHTFGELELIICATQALRNLGVKHIELFIPYLIGARSDRKFETGGVNYIKDVIAPIINSMGYEKVTIHTPHSDVTEACINNFHKLEIDSVVRFAIKNIIEELGINPGDYSKIRLLSPDAGALKRIYGAAESIGYQNEIIIAAKHRNPKTGQITHTSVPMNATDADKHIIIIDDLIDGGRTFIEIAKVIKQFQEQCTTVQPEDRGKIYLVVTHGIFSAGFTELNKYFDGIYCTNSYVDMNNNEFSLINDNKLYKLRQLNIF